VAHPPLPQQRTRRVCIRCFVNSGLIDFRTVPMLVSAKKFHAALFILTSLKNLKVTKPYGIYSTWFASFHLRESAKSLGDSKGKRIHTSAAGNLDNLDRDICPFNATCAIIQDTMYSTWLFQCHFFQDIFKSHNDIPGSRGSFSQISPDLYSEELSWLLGM